MTSSDGGTATAARAEPADPAPGPARPAAVSALDVVLSLVGLTALAVAQPLLDLLGRNAVFFVAHDSDPGELVLFALGVTLLLPLAGAALVGLGRLVHRDVGAGVHGVMIALLTATLVLVVLRVGGAGSFLAGAVCIGLAAATGVATAIAYRRSATLRRLLNLAAVAAPAVAATFLLASPVRGLVFPPPATAGAVAMGPDAPPVVVVVFDELPLASLLDGDGGLDAASYPAFARLAADATFFRNATTAHTVTMDAVPALLSGRYTRLEELPIAADHPTNLFSLLAGTYDLHVAEPVTHLCPTAGCRTTDREPAARRYSSLAKDILVIGAHLVAPADLAGGLPPLDEGWRDFAAASEDLTARDGGDTEQGRFRRDAAERGKRDAFLDGFHSAKVGNLVADFREFVRAIRPGPRPTLHVVHTLLPHRPWRYTADGRRYPGRELPGYEGRRWTGSAWQVAQGYQRHLLQVQLVDRLLGELLDRLERRNLYDRSLVVVTADHGINFTPGTRLREATRETFGAIGPVPLLVKAPGQHDGRVSDLPVESVDVVPTVLDVLDATVPAELDGRSALDPSAVPRTSRRIISAEGAVLRMDAGGSGVGAVVDRKLELFGGPGGKVDPYRLAPPGTAELLGRRPAVATTAAAPALSVVLRDPRAYADVDSSSPVLPAARLVGVVRGVAGGASPVLAVAVNGTIAAVTRADLGDGSQRGFSAMIPPRLLRDGRNDVDVLLVGRGRRLTPLAVVDG